MLNIVYQIFSSPFAILGAVFFFGASIFVHELGHFLAARWRGLKIDRFSIGMGPRLFGWTDRHGVEWRISALPIGGYVLLPQLADMRGVEGATRFSQDELTELSWTDKVVVSAAGAVFNVLFALALGSVLWAIKIEESAFDGETVIGLVQETVLAADGEQVPSPASQAGLQPGDRVLVVDGEPVEDFSDVSLAILLGTGEFPDGRPRTEMTIERDGERKSVEMSPVLVDIEQRRLVGIASAQPMLVGDTAPHSPARTAGLRAGDIILSADGTPFYRWSAFENHVDARLGEAIDLRILRAGEEIHLSATPVAAQITEAGETSPELGIIWDYPTQWVQVNPIEQVRRVVVLTFRTISALLDPRTNIGLRAMSGPVGILYTLRETFDWGIRSFLWLVIFINVNLAIVNLLPLPILDGGHIVIATWKKVFGRPISARAIGAAQGAMVAFLIAMVFYVSFFDLMRTGQRAGDEYEARQQQQRYLSQPLFPAPLDIEANEQE